MVDHVIKARKLRNIGNKHISMGKKETYFFSHDYGARNDPKLQRVLMRLQQEGKGIFWDLIEMLYEQGGILPLNYEYLAFTLHAPVEKVKDLICNYDLFCNDGHNMWSESVNRRLARRKDISEKRKSAVSSYWNRVKRIPKNTNAEQTEYKCDETKEDKRKGKEKKENNSKENKDIEIKILPTAETAQEITLINDTQCESIDIEKLAKLFNEHCPSLPKVIKLNDVRKAKVKLRLKEMGSLQNYIKVLDKMENTPFLKGQNKSKWKATFDWLIANEVNWLKVIEGNYDDVATDFVASNKINNVNDFWK